MRVALVHDWLNGMRGGEKVFEVLCELFPQADVYTLFYEPRKVSPLIRTMKVHEWWAARWIPFARRSYRWFLPVLPSAVEHFPIRNYDLVISTSHCVAKGIRPEPKTTLHISYCFTPMRYLWDKFDDYFGDLYHPASLAMLAMRAWLQQWDVKSSSRVTHFLAPSEYVRERIRRIYQREAIVLPPPVDWNRYSMIERLPSEFFLVVSALEPYKRVDVAVEACNRLRVPLKVVGTGTQLRRLRRLAGPTVEFLGWVSDSQLAALYSCARAVLFPADEDFGIVPLEAMASGCPVIAYRKGGALETVVEGHTGIFFDQQTPESLCAAIEKFEDMNFDEDFGRRHAQRFSRDIFKERLKETIIKLAGLSSGTMRAVQLP
ncbi:MAG: glycosyltransferase [Candidatus Sumerlaeaceae bacterium]|jgi:glycosyltransferase involved in cell wall biosynthesis